MLRYDAALGRTVYEPTRKDDAFSEGDHPRDKDGQFSSGGSGGKSAKDPAASRKKFEAEMRMLAKQRDLNRDKRSEHEKARAYGLSPKR